MSEVTQPIRVRRISQSPVKAATHPLAFVPPALIIAALSAIVLALLVFEIAYWNRIYPGVQMWGLDLGGMRPEEAALALEARFPYSSQPIVTLRDGDKTWTLRPRELGLELDAAAVARAAFALGRSGAILDDLKTQARLAWSGTQLAPVVRQNPVTVRSYLDNLAASVNITPSDATLRLEGMSAVATPAIVGRTLQVAPVLERLLESSRALAPVDLPLEFKTLPPAVADVAEAKAHLEAIISGPLTIVPDASVPGDVGPWTLSREELASMTVIQRVDANHIDVTLDQARLRAFLAPIAPKLERPPTDARFVFDDNLRELTVISPSRTGLAVNVPGTAARINQQALSADNRQVTLAMTVTQATFHDGLRARDLGITELITQGITYFKGSSATRIKNIKTAASRFHGIIVAPGETFSFAQFLGDVSLDQGYAEALIIYNGRTITGVGGGVCQVSTTAFRAAYQSGFPIIERWPHAYRVSWYERGFGPGLDATVFAPEVDFKFTNDSPYHLLIETYTNETTGVLAFKFYGTRDGRTVKITNPVIANVVPHGPDKYEEDSTFKPGQKEQVDWAVDGADVTVKRVVIRSGQAVTDTVFTRYQPWTNIFKVAPGEAPQPPPPEQ